MTARITARITVLIVMAVVSAPQARAESAQCQHELSVSPEREARASALTDQAFAAHAKLDYDKAATLYVEALEHWDRPDIHRHAGMAYFYGAQLLKAYRYLSEALRCGRKWIEPDDYQEAQILMDRLRPWFAEIEVQVPTEGVKGTFDGESWFAGAGSHRRVVVVGQHVIQVEKPGHVTVNKLLFVSSGERAVVAPRMLPKSQETVLARRWQRWKPWAVVGAGAAVGLIGAGVEWAAAVQFNEHEDELARLCEGAAGCTTAAQQEGVQQTWDAANLKNQLAIGAFVAGGVSVAAGIALLVLNRPRARKHPDAGRADVHMVPMISPSQAGVSLGFRFD